MRHYLILIPVLFCFSCYKSQSQDRINLLDSLNTSRENSRGVFNLYIKKFRAEVIGGFYRNREGDNAVFRPVSFTYNFYLPFQYDLNYAHLKAKEKLLKLNAVFVVHHSNYGNYAVGLGCRSSFLLFPKTYLSYQAGVVWCEPVRKNVPDGMNDMGFCLQHQFALSYAITKRFEFSLNAVHISNGNIFNSVNNLQDVIGVGVGYQIE